MLVRRSEPQIAQALHSFLRDVIQDLEPFRSSESIRKGQRWESEIGKRLAETNYGIVCLTKDNLTALWIHLRRPNFPDTSASNQLIYAHHHITNRQQN
jgi:hypothetical protein